MRAGRFAVAVQIIRVVWVLITVMATAPSSQISFANRAERPVAASLSRQDLGDQKFLSDGHASASEMRRLITAAQ